MRHTMQLNNKRVLLTGATGGIGHALCLSLVEVGCHLILVGRNQELLTQLIQQLPSTGDYLLSVYLKVFVLLIKPANDSKMKALILMS